MQERDYATALPYLQELAARNPQDVTMRIELAKAWLRPELPTKRGGILHLRWRKAIPTRKEVCTIFLVPSSEKWDEPPRRNRRLRCDQLSEAFQQKSYRDQDPDAQP